MDLWIIAAATGAGYLAKYLQNQSNDGDSLSQSSNSVAHEHSNHLLNKFSRRKKRYEFDDGRMEGTSSDKNPLDIASSMELASMNELDEPIRHLQTSGRMAEDYGVLLCDSSRNMSAGRNRSKSKTRLVKLKSVSSFEDFLMERNEEQTEHYRHSLTPPSSPTSRLFLETACTVNNETGKGCERKSRSSSEIVRKEHLSKTGSPDELSILYLGVFIGLISSSISNQREAHKLKEMLKQTEILVQDLQEELKMKDSMKVKELTDDNCESQHTFSNVFSERTGDESSPKHVIDYSINFDVKQLYEQKAEESSESMSRIEAELEAELERLGLNISSSNMARFSGVDEIDSEFKEDFAEGELRNDMNSGQNSTKIKLNEGGSNSTAHSGNYAVSPRELSLRLHDIIQFRLEARVKELEIALQNNQRKLQLINTKYNNCWHEMANDELQSSFNEA